MIEIKNVFEVPPQLWKQWSPAAKNTFNNILNSAMGGYEQKLFHPDMNIPIDQFAVIAQNIGVFVAFHVDEHLLDFQKFDGENRK